MPEEYKGSSVYEYAYRRFGAATTLRTASPSVGTTTTRVLDNNPRRVFWLIVNNAVSDANIFFEGNASFGSGILLAANGGSASMSADEDGEVVGYAVYGALGAGTGMFYTIEVITV